MFACFASQFQNTANFHTHRICMTKRKHFEKPSRDEVPAKFTSVNLVAPENKKARLVLVSKFFKAIKVCKIDHSTITGRDG